MVRRGGADGGGGGGDDEHFVLCDFNLAVVNADQFDHSRVLFGSDGWSLRSHRFMRASAKDHDCFSSGLLIATSCCASAHKIVEENGDVCFHDSLSHLIETAQANKDLIRHDILEVALSLCLLDISIHDALQKLQALHAGLLEGSREKTSAVKRIDASRARAPLAGIQGPGQGSGERRKIVPQPNSVVEHNGQRDNDKYSQADKTLQSQHTSRSADKIIQSK